MKRLRLSRIFWMGAAAILVVAALVAIGAVLRGDFSDSDGRILMTLAVLLYTGGTSLAGLALADRGPARPLGWIVVAAAPVCLALTLWGIWRFAFEGEGDEDATKLAWSAVIALLPGLIAVTGLLLARAPALVGLAVVAGAIAVPAAALSLVGMWTEPTGDGIVKVLAALWILALLAYFLVPVLQRFTSAGAAPTESRVLATLGDVQLIATRSDDGVDLDLRPGERLALRRSPRVPR